MLLRLLLYLIGVWTGIIAAEIYRKNKMSCNWSFIRSKAYSLPDKFVTFAGDCPTCKASINGLIKHEPKEGESVPVNLLVRGYDSTLHNGEKRRLTGAEARKHFESTKGALKQRIEMARDEMELFEGEPPTMPTLNAIRCGQYRKRAALKLSSDPLTSLQMLKYLTEYNSIKTIAMDPFCVHYWSIEQMRVFDVYRKQAKYTKVCVDASGGFVNKLKRPDSSLSRQILLYSLVIYHNNSIVPICMMLSEQHHGNAIGNWLLEWIRGGGSIPNEFVSDMSMALLNAAVTAFARCPTTKDYCRTCFHLAKNQNSNFRKPECYIRLDLAHLMKTILGWDCYKGPLKEKVSNNKSYCIQLIICYGVIYPSSSLTIN